MDKQNLQELFSNEMKEQYNKGLDLAINLTQMNKKLLSIIPGSEIVVESLDSLIHQFETAKFPIEKNIDDLKDVNI